jgi:hypothetical protein
MFGYQSCGYEKQIKPQYVSQSTINQKLAAKKSKAFFVNLHGRDLPEADSLGATVY